MGTYECGSDRWSAKLTEAEVVEIRSLYKDGMKLKDLAKRFPKVSKPNLHHIVHNRRWRHLL